MYKKSLVQIKAFVAGSYMSDDEKSMNDDLNQEEQISPVPRREEQPER